MATISNLYVDAGTDYSVIITLRDANGVMDLSGYTVKSQMRKSYDSSVAYSFLATIFDAVAGKVKLALSSDPDDPYTSVIPAGRWLYDVEISASGGVPKKRAVEGIVTVDPQITQT